MDTKNMEVVQIINIVNNNAITDTNKNGGSAISYVIINIHFL